MKPTPEYRVDFQPTGRRLHSSADASLLEAAQAAGVELISLCGGIGSCTGCRVRLASGKLSPITLEEESYLSDGERAEGYRLACQAYPLSDVVLDIPPESLTTPQRLQIDGQSAGVQIDPVVSAVDVQVPLATIHDLRSDFRRIADALGHSLKASPNVLQQFSELLYAHEGRLRLAVRGGERLVGVLPQGVPLLGLAVDVGSTKLAAYLVDLGSGATLAKAGEMNPQIAYGEDVISRIVYCDEHPEGRDTLLQRLVETLNTLIDTLCAEASAAHEQIVEVVLVGNSVMHHLIAGLPVRMLGQAPYVPVMDEALEFPAPDIGLHTAPGAQVYMPPLIAGFVGADHVAMLLATEAWASQQTCVALDIGTNTEVTLVHEGKRWSCSCASGPAFEGMSIRDGMRAAPGAIERVQMRDGVVMIKTIGEKPAVGICGSGILDAVAVMHTAGIVDHRGALDSRHPLVHANVFVLSPASEHSATRQIGVSRGDVSQIQLAKAAIRAGVEILLDHAGISFDSIRSFIIAGAFGSYINVESAVQIGMFPPLPLERFSQVGNAAGVGACQLLVSQARRTTATQIVDGVHYVELTAIKHFQSEFIDQLHLGQPTE